ncbi:PREDICTED: nucleolar protein 10 [Tarenaya hassleriana]|uniref:nucleolar protein 10 n=1 Tax=Tarenaya hassleriana TaxID=28532 RepID=UPI00053C862F|nr:PREDICTED: nucleolar protein 10 [Tarenaya hassleriana]
MASYGERLKSTSINGVKMYHVSSAPNVATWLNPKKQRALRKNPNYTQRVELIQDLRFETATTKIKATPDGEFLIASGIYPPQIKVYELRQLALKFERHLDAEIVDFEILDDDYSKLAFLCADRSVNLHAKYGKHYSLRIPRMGRDMAYDSWSCDLLCAASSPELYRINLEQGRFLAPLSTQSPALNVVSRSKLHGLVACGGDDGAVECFDTRMKSSAARINAVSHGGDTDAEVTAVEFDDTEGIQVAIGSSTGKVLIYDLRTSTPIRVKDHMYGSPILNIKWQKTLNSQQPKLITTDKHIVRVWDPNTGEGMTSIEPTQGEINDICVFNESGLMLLALDSSQIPSYFIPELGPAPKWCSTLENLTEELEETGQTTIYDNYKFLTRQDLDKLQLSHLIGTDLLKAYMHGFFVDYRLYKKAVAVADPFAYESYLERKKQEKLEAERSQRITKKRRLPKVNRELAATILHEEETEEELKGVEDNDGKKVSKKKKPGISRDVFEDDRFKTIFQNPDFQIDKESKEYMALHPIAASSEKQASLLEEHFEPVEDSEKSDSDASESSDDEMTRRDRKSKAPKLLEVKDERHAEAFYNRVSLAKEDALPLGERVKALEESRNNASGVKLGPGGSREISFRARSLAKYREEEEEEEGYGKKRRGVQSLGLKQVRIPGGFRGRGGRRGGRGGGGGRGRR